MNLAGILGLIRTRFIPFRAVKQNSIAEFISKENPRPIYKLPKEVEEQLTKSK